MILVVAMLVVGPSRLPAVAANVTKLVKRTRVELTKWRAVLDSEMGEDFKQMDLSKLDPRQYDPRRLIREAVQEEMDEWKKLMNPLSDVSAQPSRTPRTGGNAPALTSAQKRALEAAAKLEFEQTLKEQAAAQAELKRKRIRSSAPPTMRVAGRNVKHRR